LRSLLTAFPEAEFDLLTGSDGPRILGDFDPRVTRIWHYNRRFPGRLLLQRKLTRAFLGRGYERIYVFETKSFYHRWLRSAGRSFFGLGPGNTTHFCDRCLDLVQESIDGPIVRGWVELQVRPEGQTAARDLLTAHGIGPRTCLVGLHPTFSGTPMPFFRDRSEARHRMWPRASFASLAMLLKQEAGHSGLDLALVIDALPQERSFVEPIARLSGGDVILLTPSPDFQRYKGFLRCLDVLVTPNTGPMHIAAAVGTPLVALFSGWKVSDCGPYMDPSRYRVLKAEDTADPGRGLTSIEPEAVAEAVWSLLADRIGGDGCAQYG
jgi:ADP-heptose:LPS heptosyltransferase